jgi:hypothetical protein
VTNIEIDIPCPKCRTKIRLSLEDVRPGEGRPCPSCGSTITFAGAGGSKVQRALDELGDQGAGVKTRVKINIKRKP